MIVFHGQHFLDEISNRIDVIGHKFGDDVVRAAKTYVHVRTGELQRSIDYKYDRSNHSISFIVGAPYGLFVEYGTRHSHAYPYLRPALNTVGTIYGFETSMQFTAFETDKELLVAGSRYIGGKGLTAGQKRHVSENLKPKLLRHHIGNVSRAEMKVKTVPKKQRKRF